MIFFADNKRTEREFQAWDWVYLKIQPYRQLSISGGGNQKLNPKFYGSYEVLQKVGKVAYKLNLPPESTIHPIFHVSQLKKQLGRRNETSPTLPWVGVDGNLKIEPAAIKGRRLIKRRNEGIAQVLIKWSNLSDEDSTW
jgi:hypothetical protein